MNKILVGDCLIKLKELDDNSVDSIVTDPPYELGFMGKSWDNTGIANNKEMWAECLRVLKPGGHLLAFSGTRTYHRMACAIEDAGFEVRDMIEWVYGSGFPKSLNIGKAVKAFNETGGSSPRNLRKARMGKDYEPTGQEDYRKGRMFSSEIENDNTKEEINNEWEGWGTALKPAHEPICMARKPLGEKTVAENCLKYGTGGINIDESRVESNEKIEQGREGRGVANSTSYHDGLKPTERSYQNARFPANLLHDNSEEVRECFPDAKGASSQNNYSNGKIYRGQSLLESETKLEGHRDWYNDNGNASRFFKGIEQVVDLNDFSIYNRSILTNIKQLCGLPLTKKKIGIMLDGVIQEAEKFIQDAELLMSGNNTTIEKFLTDTASTIKILIAQMTELKTLNVLPNWLIMKFTEDYEQGINSLKELNTENVKTVKNMFLLQTFTYEVLESIRDIVKNVVEQDYCNGEPSKNGAIVKDNSRFFKSIIYQAKASKSERNKGCDGLEEKIQNNTETNSRTFNDRCLTCKKKFVGSDNTICHCPPELKITDKTIYTNKNNHPTVKPIALMEYLIKMVTPKGGVVLDPFAGSGSTLVAAKQNGYQYIGIEMTKEYIPIIEARLNSVTIENKLF